MASSVLLFSDPQSRHISLLPLHSWTGNESTGILGHPHGSGILLQILFELVRIALEPLDHSRALGCIVLGLPQVLLEIVEGALEKELPWP
jgi:hypothetical protein